MSTHALHVEATVRGAKIGGDDGPCCTGDAPPPVEVRVLLMALELEVGVADLATLEESLAKSYDGHAITPLRRSSYPHTLPTEENLVETVNFRQRLFGDIRARSCIKTCRKGRSSLGPCRTR